MACSVLAVAQSKETLTLEGGARLTVYMPDKPTTTVIVMCPGGGYGHQALTHEGHDMAQWMNTSLGVAYAVLEYRLPHNAPAECWQPLSDAEQAVMTMRSRGMLQVGIMGGSAGGHLAATLATRHRTPLSRADFQVLLYPVISMDRDITNRGTRENLIGWDAPDSLAREFSLDRHVTPQTPPAFIVLSDDDTGVAPENSLRYYRALHQAGVSCELHIYPTGGHGWGFKDSFVYKRQWTGELEQWLRKIINQTK